MKRYLPGYCMTVWNRIHVSANGQCTPCCYATGGDLVLGSLVTQDFDEIWNSPTAQDLRRSMATWDYPSLCSTCYFVDKPGVENHLPFVDDVLEKIGRERRLVDPTLQVNEPAHMIRADSPPTIVVEAPEGSVETYLLALALGGESEHLE